MLFRSHFQLVIGSGFKKDAAELEKLLAFSNNADVLETLATIKLENKKDFSNFLKADSGVLINPYSRFDVQVKRLHEYKRQLLNVLKIIGQYLELQENPSIEVCPQTFIFGAKAAASYYHAKRIIQLINCLASDIKKNKTISEKLSVVFIENYNVSKAERIFAASEVSEQISLAGKEASGTGNMKFMINGAVTLGTIDGANVEIGELVGQDNIFNFGLTASEVEELWAKGYSSLNFYTHSDQLKNIIEALKKGFNGESFSDIANYLLFGSYNIADPYMCLADFESYKQASERLDSSYKNSKKWNSISLVNIAKSGFFSSDRSIKEYAKNIWGL